MLFPTTEERLKRLEKRLDYLEKRFYKNMKMLGDSFTTIIDVVERMGEENDFLKKEKEQMIERQKDLLKSVPSNKLKEEVLAFAEPVKQKIADNFEFIQLVAREGLQGNATEKDNKEGSGKRINASMYELCELADSKGEVSFGEAARKLGVHEVQIDAWAKSLQEHGFAEIAARKGKKFLKSTGKVVKKHG